MNPLERTAAWDAARGRCGACGWALGAEGVLHHRQAKGMGGRKGARQNGQYTDGPPNAEVIHDACHKWLHANPARARDTGHIVSQWADVSEVPVTVVDELRNPPRRVY